MQTTDPKHSPAPDASSRSSAGLRKLPGVEHIIAVGSGKGGVGKSTVSVNLAVALQQSGARVGLVDADILGPSIPGMLGHNTVQPPLMTPDNMIIPLSLHGLKTISMGMLTDDDSPTILRGPMVTKYLRSFIEGVQWGDLDYLILDLAPGTGDTQLTLAQVIPLSGAIIVTTPQDVSLKIARRGLRMFEAVQVPILGVIENMSTFTCSHCGKDTDIFRRGGGEQLSQQVGVPFLGAIPLDADIVTSGDEGLPIVLKKPDSSTAQAYLAIVEKLKNQLQEQPTTVLNQFVWSWDTSEGAPSWLESAVRPSGSRIAAIGFRRRDARTLSVLWEDGHQNHYDVRDLRLACRCAKCVDETSGRPLLNPKSIKPDVSPITVRSMGNYAITFDWNDGHSTGIYTFKNLRALGELAEAGVVEDV